MPTRRAQALVGALLLGAAALVVLTSSGFGDYQPGGEPAAGNSAPSILALLDGDLDRFFSHQPLLGPVSLLLRAPFAGIAQLLGGGDLAVYQAGVFACLLGPAALGLQLFRIVVGRGCPAWQGVMLAALCVLNPLTFEGASIGHPEEALAGALVVGAVLAAPKHPLAAGLVVGLAVATKQWALVAVPVVLVAATGRRVALLATAAVVAACLLVPMNVADPDAARSVREGVLELRQVNVLSVWYPLASAERRPGDGVNTVDRVERRLPFGASRSAVAALIVVVALVLALLLWRRTGAEGPGAGRAMALLAALLILRCAADPSNLEYYAAGSLLAVCAWEALTRTGLPVISLLYTATVWVNFGPLLSVDDPTTLNALYLALSALFVGYMTLAAFAPERIDSGPARGRGGVLRAGVGSPP